MKRLIICALLAIHSQGFAAEEEEGQSVYLEFAAPFALPVMVCVGTGNMSPIVAELEASQDAAGTVLGSRYERVDLSSLDWMLIGERYSIALLWLTPPREIVQSDFVGHPNTQGAETGPNPSLMDRH